MGGFLKGLAGPTIVWFSVYPLPPHARLQSQVLMPLRKATNGSRMFHKVRLTTERALFLEPHQSKIFDRRGLYHIFPAWLSETCWCDSVNLILNIFGRGRIIFQEFKLGFSGFSQLESEGKYIWTGVLNYFSPMLGVYMYMFGNYFRTISPSKLSLSFVCWNCMHYKSLF